MRELSAKLTEGENPAAAEFSIRAAGTPTLFTIHYSLFTVNYSLNPRKA